ncbi:MAG: ADP-glyceromanno-heptose 6-epimerase [Parachlamydiales bacterium]|nr:ADP-glyceromanno-heptose 6-epimerase [Parachlamydiales bacterium]
MNKKKLDKKLTVITGAAGFIGSCLVRYLNDLGFFDLLLVDDLKVGKWKNLVGKAFYDIISKEDLFEYLKTKKDDIESIIHLGACSDTTCMDENYLLENNYRYTKRLAEFALNNDKRFIYASSAATYGDGKLGFLDNHDQLEELRPINMYGYSKHLFDLWAKRENVLDKIVGLKYFNVFGPNEYHKGKMASMILKMHKKVFDESKIFLFKSNDLNNFKDGEQVRDFIYVKDAVKMTALFLQDKYKNFAGIFNIGSGKANTWNLLASSLFKSLKKKINIQYIDMPQELLHQYQNYTCADMTKFKKMVQNNFEITNIEDSVFDYVQNYLIEDKRW